MKAGSDLVTLSIKRPDEALFRKSEDLLASARSYRIVSPDVAIAAGEDLVAVKTLAKQVEEKRTAITGPINQALREVNALFKPAQEWLAEAERLLKGALLAFNAEQARIAGEAQAKADAEAAKEREKLERQAERADAKGRTAEAEELHSRAQAQVAPVVTSAAPKIAGLVGRETWRAEVLDKAALVRHVVEARPDLMALLQVDQAGLNGLARTLKDALVLPGVRVVKEASIAARGH